MDKKILTIYAQIVCLSGLMFYPTVTATLPQLFFPTVVAVNKQTGELTVGVDTYKPSVRKSSKILQPIRPTNKVDKVGIIILNP